MYDLRCVGHLADAHGSFRIIKGNSPHGSNLLPYIVILLRPLMGYVGSSEIAIGLCRRNHGSVALLQPCLSKRGDPVVILLDGVYEAEYLRPLPLGDAVLRPLLCGLVRGQVHEDLFREHFVVWIARTTEFLAVRIVLELERRRVEPERCFVVDVPEVALLISAALVGVLFVSATRIDVRELDGAGML